MTVSAHVLDGTQGGPLTGVGVRLDRLDPDGVWEPVVEGMTDGGGRFGWFESGGLDAGTYRWVFATGDFYARQGVACFHPEVPVVFTVAEPAQKYHVPLLLSPFSYTTYRGY